MNLDKLLEHKESRGTACAARYHAHKITLSLELFYWTGDCFHYRQAIEHFEDLVSEMAKFQNEYRKERKND